MKLPYSAKDKEKFLNNWIFRLHKLKLIVDYEQDSPRAVKASRLAEIMYNRIIYMLPVTMDKKNNFIEGHTLLYFPDGGYF